MSRDFFEVSRFERDDFIVSIAFSSLKNTIATIKHISVCLEETSPYLRKLFPKKILHLNALTHTSPCRHVVTSSCIYMQLRS